MRGQNSKVSMAKPRLNITFPVLNEEAQLASSIERTIAFCAANGIDVYEFCIADNGSTDRTGEIARGLAARHAQIRLVHLDRRGFGLALKAAWAETDADFVGYMDIDLATDLSHLREVNAHICGAAPYDLYLGSRLARGASVRNRSLLRGFLSRSFNTLLAWRLGISFTDATCGFKFVRRELYRQLEASLPFSDDWFFVVELAVRAERAGARILDMPVAWTDQPHSKSSARLVNLSLLYLAGISELRREIETASDLPTTVAARAQDRRRGE
jgi:glycosyltransferase involved in cell wall biosynthesis